MSPSVGLRYVVIALVLAGCGQRAPTATGAPAVPQPAPQPVPSATAPPAAASVAEPAAKAPVESAAAALVGKTLPPYPDGLDDIQGSCIPGGEGLDHACDYGLAALGRRNDDGSAQLRYLVLSRNIDTAARDPRWQVMDAVEIPPIAAGEQLLIADCRLDGAAQNDIAAIVRDQAAEILSDLVWARRFDAATGTLVEVPLDRVDCINPGYGEWALYRVGRVASRITKRHEPRAHGGARSGIMPAPPTFVGTGNDAENDSQ